jgi:hypothetical protein
MPLKRDRDMEHWGAEDVDAWEGLDGTPPGREAAKRNLILSIVADHVGFSIWSIWSVMVLFMPAAVYHIDAANRRTVIRSAAGNPNGQARRPRSDGRHPRARWDVHRAGARLQAGTGCHQALRARHVLRTRMSPNAALGCKPGCTVSGYGSQVHQPTSTKKSSPAAQTTASPKTAGPSPWTVTLGRTAVQMDTNPTPGQPAPTTITTPTASSPIPNQKLNQTASRLKLRS